MKAMQFLTFQIVLLYEKRKISHSQKDVKYANKIKHRLASL